ncbi:MAG TPA: hypothetical protein VNS79_12825 [Sphingobium sp.]|nr:hypothetical protein [Sphingobium sp.]
MSNARTGAMVAMAVLLLCGCSKKEEPAPTINSSMADVMEPTAQAIWDIMSRAYNAAGDGLDSTKISSSDWKALQTASLKLKERAEMMALADHLVVANDHQPILGSQAVGTRGRIGAAWDAVSAQQVQARIDAEPALFAQKARALADTADRISHAADARNARLFYTATSGLDEVCDACHEPFWGTDEPPPYPHDASPARPSTS